MNTYDKIATKIVKEQELIIGPIAWREAEKISGAQVDIQKKEIAIPANDKEVIDQLVLRYERFFGAVSHEVCKDAARPFTATMQPQEIPSSLR